MDDASDMSGDDLPELVSEAMDGLLGRIEDSEIQSWSRPRFNKHGRLQSLLDANSEIIPGAFRVLEDRTNAAGSSSVVR